MGLLQAYIIYVPSSSLFHVEPGSQVRILHVIASSGLCTGVLRIPRRSSSLEEDDLPSDILGAARSMLRFAQRVRADVRESVPRLTTRFLVSRFQTMLRGWVIIEICKLVKVLEPLRDLLAWLQDTCRSFAFQIKVRAHILLSAEKSWLVESVTGGIIHESKVDNTVCSHDVVEKVACLGDRIILSLMMARDGTPVLPISWCCRGRRGARKLLLNDIYGLLETQLLLLLKQSLVL